jgi:uncharacterized membrane protein YdjX (TVP38/TMEM64 family)
MRRDSKAIRTVPSTRSALVRAGGLILILAVTSLVGYELGWFDYQHTLEHVERIRTSHSFVAFAVGFVIVYGLGTSVGVPGLPFTVAAGAIFGMALGSVLAWIGALIGATNGYFVARTIGHDVVLRWMKHYARIDAAVAQSRDFSGMLRLRLIPVIPLGTVNFVAGVAKAPFARYMAATAIGVIPSTLIYTYFADSLVEGVGSGRTNALVSLVVASALLILLSLTPRIVRNRQHGVASSVSARSRGALSDEAATM